MKYWLLLVLLILTSCTTQGVATFTFDDGTVDQYENAFPILKEQGVEGTLFVITGLNEFENETLLTWEQIDEMADNGWDIECHTHNHRWLPNLTTAAMTAELQSCIQALDIRSHDPIALAPPYGGYDEHVKNIAMTYFDIVRPSHRGYNTIDDIDWYDVKSQWMVNTTSIETMKSWIDKAYENDEWVVVMVHLVKNNLSREYTITPADLEELIMYTKEKGVAIKTLREMYEEKN